MFIHDLKYGFLMAIRDKSQIFWSLIFTVILGTLFYVSFGNIYEKEVAHTIDVVCFFDDENIHKAFDENIAEVRINEDGDKLLNITYASDMEEAMNLLDDNRGLFYSENGELKVMLKDNGVYESMLAVIVRKFHQTQSVIENASANGGAEIIPEIVSILSDTTNNNADKKLTDGNMDPYLIYFYNLLAMSCLFSSFSVLDITSRNQGNLSFVGARKCMSSTNVIITSLAEIVAHVIVMYALTVLSFVYLTVIGVDFGHKIFAILLILLMGVILGTSLGFFIGSIKISSSLKQSLVTGISLALCFFSGLMIANIRPYIEENCPIFDKINPASMICDSFYALNVYDNYDRVMFNIISMLITSTILIAGGILIGRRKNYASL